MSLKPPKKSDMGKSWMKPRRDKNILLRPEYHLTGEWELQKMVREKMLRFGSTRI